MSSERLDLSSAAVDVFLARTVEDEAFVAAVRRRRGDAGPDPAVLLGNIASEARLACGLLESLHLRHGDRILEIGAGSGVVAAFLRERGADVSGIEPIIAGFEPFLDVRAELAAVAPLPPIAPITAEQLDPGRDGVFDVIVSVNVLEHMHPLDGNLDAMTDVLAPEGTMIHTCPNYRVPYEPHCRVPLVPGRPGATRHLARRAGSDPVWPTLNWITAGDVIGFARRRDLAVEFRGGELARSLERLRSDPEFARRQSGVVIRALTALDRLGVTGALRRIPPTWMTPMTFTLRRRAAPAPR